MIRKILLYLISFALFLVTMLFAAITALGVITRLLGGILLLLSAIHLIVIAIPQLLLLPQITFYDIVQNIVIWVILPLPFLFWIKISVGIIKPINKLRDKISDLIDSLSGKKYKNGGITSQDIYDLYVESHQK